MLHFDYDTSCIYSVDQFQLYLSHYCSQPGMLLHCEGVLIYRLEPCVGFE